MAEHRAVASGDWHEVRIYPTPAGASAYYRQINERKRAELERETTLGFLRLINQSASLVELVRAATTFFQQQSGCEAVGIRLRDGDDYPYFEARGFPEQFVLLENSLCARDAAGRICRDKAGYPIMECMCGNVICGRFDAAQEFFSERGSFSTGNTTTLLATSSEEDRQARTRNRCNGEGYESVALIALRTGEERLGLLQLNDRNVGRFAPEDVALWERLADQLAVAVGKMRLEEELRRSRQEREELLERERDAAAAAAAVPAPLPQGELTAHSMPLAWLVLPALTILVVLLAALRVRAAWPSTPLFIAMNLIVAPVSLVVAYLAARTYLAERSRSVLLLGCGGLSLGFGFVLVGLHVPGTTQNALWALDGVLICLGGFCHLAGVLSGPSAGRPRAGSAWPVVASYAVVATVLLVCVVLIRSRLWPLVFVEGSGQTGFGRATLVVATILFALSALVLAVGRRFAWSDFRYWYALGLGMMALAAGGSLFELRAGDAVNWTVRLSLCLSALFLLLAVWPSVRKRGTWTLPLQAALRESEQRYQSLIELSPDAILVHSDGRYVFANPAGARLFGAARPDELLGRDVLELIEPAYRGLTAARVARAYGGEATAPAEMQFRRLDGSPIEAEVAGSRVEFAGRAAIQLVARDVTGRKRAEHDRQLLLEELQIKEQKLEAQAEELRLHNADLAERARLADSLNAINRLLHATLDFGTIMQGALDEGVEALAATSGLIEMREGSQWVVRYQHGLAGADVGLRLSVAEAPIATRVEERGEPLAIADLRGDAIVDVGLARTYALRSVLAVPLVARAAVTGCLLLCGNEVRSFSDAEIDFGRKLGATVSMALENARLYEEQQRIAQTLQENFLHEPPTVAGLELGVVAKTANEPELVGGDFSDVFVIDDTHIVVLIGDVAGKGVRAAGLTETVRSTVRALAAIDCSPAFVLTKANELLLRFDPDEPHVTAFLAVLDPHTGHLSCASAGHPAPVHLGAFSCRTLDVVFGPPLGTFEWPYANAHAMLTLEDYLVLFTDGVTEARRDGEMYGEARLVEAAAGLRGLSAREVAEGVLQDVGSYAHRLADDIQIVVLRLA